MEFLLEKIDANECDLDKLRPLQKPSPPLNISYYRIFVGCLTKISATKARI